MADKFTTQRLLTVDGWVALHRNPRPTRSRGRTRGSGMTHQLTLTGAVTYVLAALSPYLRWFSSRSELPDLRRDASWSESEESGGDTVRAGSGFRSVRRRRRGRRRRRLTVRRRRSQRRRGPTCRLGLGFHCWGFDLRQDSERNVDVVRHKTTTRRLWCRRSDL